MAAATPASRLRAQALLWLAQREHSRQELRRKLLAWLVRNQSKANLRAASALDSEQVGEAETRDLTEPEIESNGNITASVDALLDSLAAAGCLSDKRFVESRIHVRQARFGNRRIDQELRQHGLHLTPERQTELEATELARALQVHRSKFKEDAGQNAADRARRHRFLAARGFSSATIWATLKACSREASDSDDPSETVDE